MCVLVTDDDEFRFVTGWKPQPFCLKMDMLLYFIGMVSSSVSSKLKVEIESKI